MESPHNQWPCSSHQMTTPCSCASSIFQLVPPPHFWLLWSPSFRSCDLGQWQREHGSDPLLTRTTCLRKGLSMTQTSRAMSMKGNLLWGN